MEPSRADALSLGGGGGGDSDSRSGPHFGIHESPSNDDLEIAQLAEEVERLTRLERRLAAIGQRPLPPVPPIRHSDSWSGTDPQTAVADRPRDLWYTTPHMAGNGNNAFPPLDTSFNNRSPSPAAGGQVNGVAMGSNANYMAPLPVGHQQDLHFLYAQIQELSGILQSNRDKVTDITRSAEEVARRANSGNGHHEDRPGADDRDTDKARIRQLEHELAKSNKLISLYKHEQTENTRLIASYEDAMGTATEQIRNYCNDIDGRFLAQRKHYNSLLQTEKDEHLQSRLDRDHWQAQTVRVCEMIRTAYRLRCEEWCDEYRVIRGLQEEVRCLRRSLGMEAEVPNEETGWPYLKEDVLGEGQAYQVQAYTQMQQIS